MKTHVAIKTALRWCLATTFAVAACGKLFGTDTAYMTPRLLDASAALYAPAMILERSAPWLEAIIALALFTGIGRAIATPLAVALTSAFVLFAALLPDGTRCHCFGLFGGFGSRPLHLAVTLAMLVSAIAVAWPTRRADRGGPTTPQRLLEA